MNLKNLSMKHDGKLARFSLNNFVSKINQSGVGGFWQPNRFIVRIQPGLNMAPIIRRTLATVDNMSFLCSSAALPGVQIITSDHRRQNMGTFDRRPFGVQVTDIPLTFMLDQQGTVQNLFRTWTNFIVNYSYKEGEHGRTGGKQLFEIGYRDQYLCEVDILCLDQKQENIITYHLYEAFPMQIGDVTAAWSETDSFGVLPVQFTFRTYDINKDKVKEGNKEDFTYLQTLDRPGNLSQKFLGQNPNLKN